MRYIHTLLHKMAHDSGENTISTKVGFQTYPGSFSSLNSFPVRAELVTTVMLLAPTLARVAKLRNK